MSTSTSTSTSSDGPATQHTTATASDLLARNAVVQAAFPFTKKLDSALQNAIALEGEAAVEQKAASVRWLADSRFPAIADTFLQCMCADGTPAEQAFYRDLTAEALFERLTSKRPKAWCFCRPKPGSGKAMLWVLRAEHGGVMGWDGRKALSNGECLPGTACDMHDYLTESEVALASYLTCFSETSFVNDMNRRNGGVAAAPASEHVASGCIAGMVGARICEESGTQESVYMRVSAEQNTAANGFGSWMPPTGKPMHALWVRLLGRKEANLPSFDEVAGLEATMPAAEFAERYRRIGDEYIDVQAYLLFFKMKYSPFLQASNTAAAAAGMPAWISATGLGLGVWAMPGEAGIQVQAELQLRAIDEVLRENQLPHIGVVEFSDTWWPKGARQCGAAPDGGGTHPASGGATRVLFTAREPAGKLDPALTGGRPHLLVVQYAWDGGSASGNELWATDTRPDAIGWSGDPAAAACSNTHWLHDSEVHPEGMTFDRLQLF